MTTLGKILVFVNLVFSLLVGGLIVTVYVTRTNWKFNYDKLAKMYEVSNANANAYADKVLEIELKCKTEAEQAATQLDAAKKEIAQLQTDVKTKGDALEAKKLESEKSSGLTGVSTEELNRRKLEVATLQKQLEDRNKVVSDLEVKIKDFRDKAVAADIAAKSAQDRAGQMLQQIQDLNKQNEQMRVKSANAGTSTGALVKRPPPEDIEGVILDTDPKTGLVTISIGSDAGLSNGHTLEVYRLKPEPKYLGTIRILDTHHHEAVGRPITPQKAGALQKGDRVASSILGQR